MKQKNIVIFYLMISSLFILFLYLINFYTISNGIVNNIDRIIIGFVFIFICIIGISISFYPKWYKKILRYKNSNKNQEIKNKKRKREGHHPNCIKFTNHIILINNKKYCIGCIGLGIGAFISIILIIHYLIFDYSLSIIYYKYLFISGILLIFISYYVSLFIKKYEILHLFSNILLILSFYFVIISTFENSGHLIYAFIGIIGTFLFLETRIQISIFNHSNICITCEKECKMY